MRDELSIGVWGLSKVYKLYDRPEDRLKESLHPFRRKYHHEFFALRDVNVEIARGETVGIVGRNGSGKSTLLKIVAGVLSPTAGTVEVRGRVSALLELGAGFNPEAMGRENVFFSGTIMGLTRDTIARRLDEIIEFADIGEFIDQPVKTYSSGMFVRLAFAVAINVDPDILVIDEALAVGDDAFRRKCFGRIEAIKRRGATVVFVSHSAASVVELCDRAILLDQGEVLTSGRPKQVVAKYHQLLFADPGRREDLRNEIFALDLEGAGGSHEGATESVATGGAIPVEKDEEEEFYDPDMRPESTFSYGESNDHGVRIFSPRITTASGRQVNHLVCGRQYWYCYRVRFSSPAYHVRFGMLLKTLTGYELGGSATTTAAGGIPEIAPGSEVDVRFGFRCNLHHGTYFLNAGALGAVGGEEVYLDRVIDALMFKVLPEEGQIETLTVSFDVVPEWEILGRTVRSSDK